MKIRTLVKAILGALGLSSLWTATSFYALSRPRAEEFTVNALVDCGQNGNVKSCLIAAHNIIPPATIVCGLSLLNPDTESTPRLGGLPKNCKEVLKEIQEIYDITVKREAQREANFKQDIETACYIGLGDKFPLLNRPLDQMTSEESLELARQEKTVIKEAVEECISNFGKRH